MIKLLKKAEVIQMNRHFDDDLDPHISEQDMISPFKVDQAYRQFPSPFKECSYLSFNTSRRNLAIVA